MQSRRKGRRTRSHLADGRLDDIGAGKCKNTEKNNDGQKYIEQWAGRHDQDPFGNVFVGKRDGDISGRHLGIRILTDHFDIAAQGDGGKTVISDTDFFAEKPRSKTQGKFLHPDSEQAGNNKVAEFVEKNQHTQNDNKSKYIGSHKIN